MTRIAIVYHSRYGHTKKQAEAVRAGAAELGDELIAIDAEGNLPEGAWQASERPTPSSSAHRPTWAWRPAVQEIRRRPFQALVRAEVEGQGRRRFHQPATINGDKGSTLAWLFTLAQQHGMIWVGTGMLPSNSKAAQRNDLNWLGASVGAMAQSPSDASPEEGPLPGDASRPRAPSAAAWSALTARFVQGAVAAEAA